MAAPPVLGGWWAAMVLYLYNVMRSEVPAIPISRGSFRLAVLAVGMSGDPLCQLRSIAEARAWTLFESSSRPQALHLIRKHQIPVVICRQELADGNWRGLFNDFRTLPIRPKMVVIANRPDSSLWSKALSVGVFDLVLQPFDAFEVERVLEFTLEAGREEVRRPPSPRKAEVLEFPARNAWEVRPNP